MKTALIFAYIGIGILAFFVFIQGREIKKLQELNPKVPVNPTPPVTTTPVVNETAADSTRYIQITNSKDSMSGSELWEGIKKSIKEIDIKF